MLGVRVMDPTTEARGSRNEGAKVTLTTIKTRWMEKSQIQGSVQASTIVCMPVQETIWKELWELTRWSA